MTSGSNHLLFYHVSSTLLASNSVIMPGNWGRIIESYKVSRADLTNLYREGILEAIRAKNYSGKPSRMRSAFALPTIEAARIYLSYNNPFGILYKVEMVDKGATIHVGDFNMVQPKPGEFWISGMEAVAILIGEANGPAFLIKMVKIYIETAVRCSLIPVSELSQELHDIKRFNKIDLLTFNFVYQIQ